MIQEPLSSSFVLSKHLHLDTNLIHLIYFLATSLDIIIGYSLGLFIKKSVQDHKITNWIRNKIQENFENKNNKVKYLSLFLMGTIIFPITAGLVPFLGISFWRGYIIMITSEILFWYSGVWGLVLGFTSKSDISYLHFLLLVPIATIFLYKKLSKRQV